MHYRDLFYTKLWYNLESEAKKTYLGYAWWLLEPTLHVLVFYVVFEKLLQRGGEGFLIFLLCGNIPYLWFSKTVSNASSSILSGQGLISQVPIAKSFFPLMIVLTDLVKQAFVFLFFFLFLLIYGVDVHSTWIYIPVVVLVQLLVIVAAALVSAAITPFFPDLRHIIPTLLMLVMFGSGIFYSYKAVVSLEYQRWFMMNPMANLIENFRMVIIQGVPPDWISLGIIALISCSVIAGMGYFFKRADSAYARLVAQ